MKRGLLFLCSFSKINKTDRVTCGKTRTFHLDVAETYARPVSIRRRDSSPLPFSIYKKARRPLFGRRTLLRAHAFVLDWKTRFAVTLYATRHTLYTTMYTTDIGARVYAMWYINKYIINVISYGDSRHRFVCAEGVSRVDAVRNAKRFHQPHLVHNDVSPVPDLFREIIAAYFVPTNTVVQCRSTAVKSDERIYAACSWDYTVSLCKRPSKRIKRTAAKISIFFVLIFQRRKRA